ncbi:hypothetical protein E4T56_gene16497 [Termitomyces sp. T112]|nr:hypothetical protein E4T56_gene16497 [Termitomyces sp. T112]
MVTSAPLPTTAPLGLLTWAAIAKAALSPPPTPWTLTLFTAHLLPQSPPFQCPIKPPNHCTLSVLIADNSDASPANSNGLLAHSDTFSKAVNTSPDCHKL